MKCPKCNGEMEKGMLTGDARHWMKEQSIGGQLNKFANPGFGLSTVWAFKCGSCKKIELNSD